MLNLIIRLGLIALIASSCNSIKKTENYTIKSKKTFDKKMEPKIVYCKVVSIDSIKSVFIIMVANRKEYKVLSRKSNVIKLNQKKLRIGNHYKFKLSQLTHQNMDNEVSNFELNGVKVIVSPTHYLIDCVKFNTVEFCSNSYEVYEGLNLNGLYYYQLENKYDN